MKKVITGLAVACFVTTALQAQLKKEVQVIPRKPVAVVPKKALAAKPFTLAEASAASGKALKPTDAVKTISGKTITMEEYLRRVNKIEESMTEKGATLRSFKPTSGNLVRKPVVLEEAKINTINVEINKNVKPLLNLQSANSKVFLHKSSAGSLSRASQLIVKNPQLSQKLKDELNAKKLNPETIEKTYDVDRLLKPLADKINAELDNDDAQFSLTAASLVVRSHAAPPASLGNSTNTDLFSTTASEYKVAVNFGASMKLSIGLPINVTIPLATMNGEFISPANTSKKLSRKVVVNLLGRSLFNRTAVVNSNELEEEFTEELDIAELVSSPAMSTSGFLDGLPSVGFNTDISTMGAVGCTYKADMTRSNVDAYIGPTYSARIRIAASFGLEDVLEGGIEGIVTLLTGAVGFGGNAGLDYVDNKWKLVNNAYVESTLEALKGEVNLFVKYPDMLNWSCGFAPCIKTDRFSLFKTPVAFKLRGTLLEDDNSKTLTW